MPQAPYPSLPPGGESSSISLRLLFPRRPLEVGLRGGPKGRKVHFDPFPPDGENGARSLAPFLPTKPSSRLLRGPRRACGAHGSCKNYASLIFDPPERRAATLTRRDLIWKWTAYGLVLVLVTLINYCVLNLLPLGAVPVLIPVTAVAVGVLEGARSGAGFGLAAGLVMAAATHGSVAWIFLLCLAGWVCGLLAMYVLRRDLVGYLLACLAVGLLYELGQVLPRLLSGGAGPAVLLRVAGLEYLWTMVFSLPVYGLCHLCCRKYGRIYHE